MYVCMHACMCVEVCECQYRHHREQRIFIPKELELHGAVSHPVWVLSYLLHPTNHLRAREARDYFVR